MFPAVNKHQKNMKRSQYAPKITEILRIMEFLGNVLL